MKYSEGYKMSVMSAECNVRTARYDLFNLSRESIRRGAAEENDTEK
jgi:hypothetical protein